MHAARGTTIAATCCRQGRLDTPCAVSPCLHVPVLNIVVDLSVSPKVCFAAANIVVQMQGIDVVLHLCPSVWPPYECSAAMLVNTC